MKLQKRVLIDLPMVPHFISTSIKSKSKKQSLIPTYEFSDSDLKEIGREWTNKLIETSKKNKQDIAATLKTFK